MRADEKKEGQKLKKKRQTRRIFNFNKQRRDIIGGKKDTEKNTKGNT